MPRRCSRTAAVPALFALFSCAPSDRIFVPMPPTEGAQSMIVAISSAAGLEVAAFDVSATPSAIRVAEVPAGEQVLIEALRYDRRLSDLGLPSGVLEASTDTSRAKKLPAADKRLTLSFETGEDVGGWAEAPSITPSERLSQFAIDGPVSPCAKFTIEARALESRFNVSFALAMDESHALVVTRDPAAFEVTATSIRRLSYAGFGRITGGTRWTDGSDQLWVGGDFGELYRGTFGDEVRMEFVGSSPGGGQLRWIVGGPKGDGVEVLTLSELGALSHYDGSVWRLLRQMTPDPTGLGHAGLARVGPGVTIATWPDESEVMRISGTDVRREPANSQTGLLGAGYAPGFGAIVGNAQGDVWVDRQNTGRWEPLGNYRGRLWALQLAGYEDGFVVGTTFGNMVQYVDGYGFCEPILAAAFDVRYLVTLGRDVMLLGGGGDGMNTPVIFLRRSE